MGRGRRLAATIGRRRTSALAIAAMVGTFALGAVPATAAGLKRVFDVNGTTAPAVAMARTSDGRLHLVWQAPAGHALMTMAISPSGHAGPAVSAVGGSWDPGQPGLVVLPGGTLEAVFGGISPSLVTGIWGIASTDGGST
jgi:hypothetical protein